MKYSQLSDAAKAAARKDYQDGWLEAHTDIFTDEELDGFCKDTEEEVEYEESGLPKQELSTFDPRAFCEKLVTQFLNDQFKDRFVVQYKPSHKGGTLIVRHPNKIIERRAQFAVNLLVAKE